MKYLVKSEQGDVILSSYHDQFQNTHRRSFVFAEKNYLILLEAESKSESKSPRIRQTYFEIIEKAVADLQRLEQERFNKYNHIIQTISTQISQKLEGYFGDKRWYSNSYAKALENLENFFLQDTDETRKLVHYFNKTAIDLKNHIEGWEVIYIKKNYKPEFVEVSLKKAILNQFSSFSEEFDDLDISVKFSPHFLDECTVSLDKKLFSLIMYNFFSNALKYSLPGDEIRFNYNDESKSLDVSMYSVKMEKNELNKIFEDGVRGVNANKVSSSGYGLGLFVVKRALEIMEFENMYINPQYTKTKTRDEVLFVENHFQFKFSENE